jgi:hypothetical protein
MNAGGIVTQLQGLFIASDMTNDAQFLQPDSMWPLFLPSSNFILGLPCNPYA